MNKTNKELLAASCICVLALLLAPSILFANANDQYGETRLSNLHRNSNAEISESSIVLRERGQVSNVPWVGNWWSYARNGLADCWDAVGYGDEGADCYLDPEILSPAEKLDAWLGRTDDIDREGLAEYVGQISSMNDLAVERRELIPRLNRWITEHPGEDWSETEDGKRYLEVSDYIEDLEKDLPEIDINTATEFEVIHHGQGVLGVDTWWGHCNAWAAAAIMEPEPRYDTVVDGISFSTADVKGYLTENWMEHRSSFVGSRANSDPDYDDEWSKLPVEYKDMTPAQFHIYTVDQIGNKDRSFVFDVFTGDQVWNHPVRGYMTKLEALYENDDTPEEVELFQTKYDHRGVGFERRGGHKQVFRVLVTTTFHYMDDGVPHDTLTSLSVNELDSNEDFASPWRIRAAHQGQVLVRTLTYELWLTHPIGNPDAEIIGDGAWKHASMIGNQNHPDFAWQPQSQTPSLRNYENPFVPYEKVVDYLLPGTLVSADADLDEDLAGSLVVESMDRDLAIPDNDIEGIMLKIFVEEDIEITGMTVIPHISHAWSEDLEIVLERNGRRIVLKRHGEGGSGRYETRPYDVPQLIGDTTHGTWILHIIDDVELDTGIIHDWRIVFN